MKKLNVILVGLLSILMLSLAIVFINRWKLNEDSQRIVLAEKRPGTFLEELIPPVAVCSLF